MKRRAYLAVLCDADPDGPLPFRRLPADAPAGGMWRGVSAGIAALRARLERSAFHAAFGPLPVTWLLRADRQIAEVYGRPAFAFEAFAGVWQSEQRLGSEIGWHPHVHRWSATDGAWRPWLGHDDDVEILRECLAALRLHADVRSARTGWTYQSNRLIELFAAEGIEFDASAIPGSVHAAAWRHDWARTPRVPYWPSRRDYRIAARSPEDAAGVCELPVMVHRLPPALHGLRYAARIGRRSGEGWEAARWQGVLITQHDRSFVAAVEQTLRLAEASDTAFLLTYFHAGELLDADVLDRFARNLEATAALARGRSWNLLPVTLRDAGRVAERVVGAGLVAAPGAGVDR